MQKEGLEQQMQQIVFHSVKWQNTAKVNAWNKMHSLLGGDSCLWPQICEHLDEMKR